MATAVHTKLMTADEFYSDPDLPELVELVDGEVVEMTTPPPLHGWIARNVQLALHAFVAPRRLGEVFADNMPYTLGKRRVRVPDVSYLSAARVPGPPPAHGGWPYAPDIAVEVVSPSERRPAILRKVADYLEAGGRQVWLVDAAERTVEVHAAEGRARTFDASATLDGGDVLPGFAMAVTDVFAGVAPRDAAG